jgi:negative regulator of sigma E activity
LEASRRDWQKLSAAHQQLNFTLTKMQQENDRLHARRFQLELERGDRLQRVVDLEAENHTLEENANAYEIENIADMQQQVEEAEVQVAALQAIVALQPLPPVQAQPEEQQDPSSLDQTSQAGPPLPTPLASPTDSGASVGN